MNFELTSEDSQRVGDWLSNVVWPPIVAAYKAEGRDVDVMHIGDVEVPLSGSASGGELTYHFTPTGIGVVIVVEHYLCAKLDLTDNGSW